MVRAGRIVLACVIAVVSCRGGGVPGHLDPLADTEVPDPGEVPSGGTAEGFLCRECAGDADCGGGVCARIGAVLSCTLACASSSGCPMGFKCVRSAADPTFRRCLPMSGSCSCTFLNEGETKDCEQSSLHGTCRGEAICDAKKGWVCDAPEPAAEQCDHEDNDCDGTTDDGFVDPASGLYATDEHCGGCGNDCGLLVVPNGHGECRVTGKVASCAAACNPGFVDVNGLPGDGCECEVLGQKDPPNGVDEDCDGIDGEPDNAVFVAPHGSDANPGTAALPVRTVQKGIAVAVVKGLGHVYVAEGVYEGPVTLAEGKEVYGGFAKDFSVRDPGGHESLVRLSDCPDTPPGTVNVACSAPGASTVFSGFTVEGPTCSQAGRTSYAVHVRNCGSALALADNVIRAGRGAAGSPGSAGSKGTDGVPGKNGAPAVDLLLPYCFQSPTNAGGKGGESTCEGVAVHGGAGGTAVCPDYDEQFQTDDCPVPGTQNPTAKEWGQDGQPASSGGPGGPPGLDSLISAVFHDPFEDTCSTPTWACSVCELADYDVNAGRGGDGAPGTPGAGGGGCGNPMGTVKAGLWTGSAGLPGGAGGAGAGGGGGGAAGGVETSKACSDLFPALGHHDLGGSGGGGGGGCGGPSVGIFAHNGDAAALAALTEPANAFELAGAGGPGGPGGASPAPGASAGQGGSAGPHLKTSF